MLTLKGLIIVPKFFPNKNKILKQNSKDQTNFNAGLVGCKIVHTMQSIGSNSVAAIFISMIKYWVTTFGSNQHRQSLPNIYCKFIELYPIPAFKSLADMILTFDII